MKSFQLGDVLHKCCCRSSCASASSDKEGMEWVHSLVLLISYLCTLFVISQGETGFTGRTKHSFLYPVSDSPLSDSVCLSRGQWTGFRESFTLSWSEDLNPRRQSLLSSDSKIKANWLFTSALTTWLLFSQFQQNNSPPNFFYSFQRHLHHALPVQKFQLFFSLLTSGCENRQQTLIVLFSSHKASDLTISRSESVSEDFFGWVCFFLNYHFDHLIHQHSFTSFHTLIALLSSQIATTQSKFGPVSDLLSDWLWLQDSAHISCCPHPHHPLLPLCFSVSGSPPHLLTDQRESHLPCLFPCKKWL